MAKISYADIYSRKMVLESAPNKDAADNSRVYYTRYRMNKNRENAFKFITECNRDKDTATSNIDKIIEAAAKFNLIDEMMSSIKLISKDQDYKIHCSLEKAKLSNESVDLVNDQLSRNATCDRILNNHKAISEKIKINDAVWKNEFFPSIVTHEVCSEIDRHKLPLVGKINIAIEESKYLMDLYADGPKDVTDTKLTENVLNFFMARRDCSGYISNISKIIQENAYIYYENEQEPTVLIFRQIKAFNLSPVHTFDQILEMINTVVNDVQLDKSLHVFFDFITNFLLGSLDDELCSKITDNLSPELYNAFYKYILDNDDKDNKKRINIAMRAIEDIKSKSFKFVNARNHDGTGYNRIFILSESLNSLIENMIGISGELYDIDNINCIRSTCESTDIISLNEFKIFKFTNLIHMAWNIDKYFRDRMKGYRANMKHKFNKVKSVLFENSTVYDAIYIREDNNASVDFSICVFECDQVDAENSEFIAELCKFANESMFSQNPDMQLYYIAMEDYIEIHLKQNCLISLYEHELLEYNQNIPELDIERLYTLTEEISRYDGIDFTREDFENYLSNSNDLDSFLEICSYAGIDKDYLESCLENVITESSVGMPLMYYKPLSVPLDVQLESLQLLSYVVEGGNDPKKNSNMKAKIQNVSINGSKAVSGKNGQQYGSYQNGSSNDDIDETSRDKAMNKINSAKLYLSAIKTKSKDANAAVQQAERNADVTFNNFAKSIKDAFISNRREAVIKGSVIPSFSKCIKWIIAFAGIGGISNVIVPGSGLVAAAISAFGALAVSKKLTKNERVLMLDDLEVELEMIDKEISLAESRNQLKKMRALMITKKNLQRQYQRIKYNIRVGKDLLPSSALGVKTFDQ